MAVMTVVALFYYAGVARSLWLGTQPEGAPELPAPRVSPTLGAAIALATAGVLVLGVLPEPPGPVRPSLDPGRRSLGAGGCARSRCPT
jgi:NADH:ubiquinone oxidoreductase subunit 2 (subunit N)